MILYILRHTDALLLGEEGVNTDEQRPLSSKGIKRAEAVGKLFTKLGVTLDKLFSSPAVRCKHTATLVADNFNNTLKVTTTKLLSSPSDPEAFIALLISKHGDAKNVLVVGHSPELLSITSKLIGCESNAIDLKKGGLIALEVNAPLQYGKCAKLIWSLTPKQTVWFSKTK